MATDEPDVQMLRRMLPEVDPDAYPVPDDVLRIAEGLFLWKAVAADLAVLEESDLTLAGVRGTIVASTHMSCTLPGDEISIEIEYFASERELIVDLGGSDMTAVRLSRLDGVSRDVSVVPDAAGICRFANVLPGWAFLVFERANPVLIKTGPFLLA